MAIPITETILLNTIRDAAPQAVVYTVLQESMMVDMIASMGGMVEIDNPHGWQWQAMVNANGSVETVAMGGDVSDGDGADPIQANVAVAIYHGAIKVAHGQLEQLMLAGNNAKIADFMVEQTADLGREFAKKWHTDIIGGTTADLEVIGLTSADGWIDDTGSPGLARATYTTWACLVQNAGGAAITETLLRTLIDTFADTKVENEDFENGNWAILCNRANFDLIKAFTGSVTLQQDVPSGTAPTKVIGYRKVEFDGIPVIRVPGYTANRVDLVDLTDVQLGYYPGKNSDGTPNGTPLHFLNPQWQGQNVTFHVMAYLSLRMKNPGKRAASLQNLSV